MNNHYNIELNNHLTDDEHYQELASMRRKIEENDCMLIQGLEELRRKDLNIRALDKTQQRLASTLTQLERDIEVRDKLELFENQKKTTSY